MRGPHSPETRAKISEAKKGKGQKHSDESKAKISAAMSGKAKSPEHRKKLSEANKGKPAPNKGVSPGPETREKISKSLTGRPGRTPSPENLAKLAEANVGRPLSAEHRAKLSAATKRWNETPEGLLHREKLRAWYGSPGNLEVLARIHDSWARSPEGKVHARRNLSLIALYGETLRKQDGDLCQLCLKPIDFSIRERQPMSRSADHIVPIRAGGGDEIENIWLAHLRCNFLKGPRWVGREDGSTDRRRES